MSRWLVFLAGALAAGCDGGASPPSADASTDAAPPNAATVIDAGADSAEAGAPSRAYSWVSIERWVRANEPMQTMGAVASFHWDQPEPSIRHVGASCLAHNGLWTPLGKAAPTFGTVTIAGVNSGTLTFTNVPDGSEFDNSPGGFDEGDNLTVSWTGAEVPAGSFTGTVLPAPTLTSHDNTGAGPNVITVSRKGPFAITWTPVDGEIFAWLLQFDTDLGWVRGVQCVFPGKDGAGAFPVEATTHLKASPLVLKTNFYFARVVRDRITLPNRDIDFLLWNGRQTRITVLD